MTRIECFRKNDHVLVGGRWRPFGLEDFREGSVNGALMMAPLNKVFLKFVQTRSVVPRDNIYNSFSQGQRNVVLRMERVTTSMVKEIERVRRFVVHVHGHNVV